MRKSKHRPFVILFSVSLAMALLLARMSVADDPAEYDSYYPNHARGYVSSLWDADEFDDINLYNGNLTARIPLGPALHPGGDVNLQLALQYNSSVWAEEDRCSGHQVIVNMVDQCNEVGVGALLGTTHVGLGWGLELGHIAPKDANALFLISSDGSEHQLFANRFGSYEEWGDCVMDIAGDVCYTRDGSDIKVVWQGPVTGYEASFSDGTTRYYTEAIQNYTHASRQERDFVGRDFARQRDGYYCTKIEDTWGNYISISYHQLLYYEEAYNHYYEEVVPGIGTKNLWQKIPSTIQEYRADGTPLRKVQIAVEQPLATLIGRSRPWRVTSISFFAPSANTFFVVAGELSALVHNSAPAPFLPNDPYSPESVSRRQSALRRSLGLNVSPGTSIPDQSPGRDMGGHSARGQTPHSTGERNVNSLEEHSRVSKGKGGRGPRGGGCG